MDGKNKLYSRAKKPSAIDRGLYDVSLIGDLNRAFATPEGKRALHFIMNHLCDWQGSSTVISPATGEILIGATAYNEGRRSIYGELRKLIKDETLKDIEFHNPQQEEKE